jgi:hypothetical protein
MSINCGIALRSGETFQTIYCHWDGYPSYMLPMLRENYNSLELAAKLISYGDASSIDKKLEPTPGVAHTFMMPEKDVCVFYHRDRGEDWISCESTCYTKQELFRQQAFDYVYIFEDETWNCYKNGRKLDYDKTR